MQLFIVALAMILNGQATATCQDAWEEWTQLAWATPLAEFNASLAKAQSPEDMQAFLRREGVKYHNDADFIVLGTDGLHPLNRLAKAYAQDDIRLAFQPTLLAQLRADAAFLADRNLVLLESVIHEGRIRRPLTIADLHELLHARIFRDAAGTYLSARVSDAGAVATDLARSHYGRDMSLSENLTYRQDLRTTLGKLKLWSREQKQEQAPRTWLEYFWPRSPDIAIESVATLLTRGEKLLGTIDLFNDATSRLLDRLERPLDALLQQQTQPQQIQTNRVVLAGQERRFADFRMFHAFSGMNPTMRFSISPKARDWIAIRGEIQRQLQDMRSTYDASIPLLKTLANELAMIRKLWHPSPEVSLLPDNLKRAIEQAHASAKQLYEAAIPTAG